MSSEPTHTIINPSAPPEVREIQARVADLVATFKSGNGVPVDRATVMRLNGARIKSCIDALELVVRKHHDALTVVQEDPDAWWEMW